MAILTVVGALALSVIGKLLADEVKAWRPKICDAMIKCAASQLLPFQRERYIEQWRCDLEEIAGDLFKLYFAADLIRGIWLARVLPGASQLMLSDIENSEEMAIRQFVFLEIACLREKVRLIMEDACPHSLPFIRVWFEQILVSFEESRRRFRIMAGRRLSAKRFLRLLMCARWLNCQTRRKRSSCPAELPSDPRPSFEVLRCTSCLRSHGLKSEQGYLLFATSQGVSCSPMLDRRSSRDRAALLRL